MKNTPLTLAFFLMLIAGFSITISALPNEVNYHIDATLDTEANIIRAAQTVTITNRTGVELSELYFHVVPNAFTRDADTDYQNDLLRFTRITLESVYDNLEDDASLTIESLTSNGEALNFSIDDTLMTVTLNQPLQADEIITLEMVFVNDLIQASVLSQAAALYAVRSGFRDGVYTITKWYPQLVVYDEAGWHLDHYRLMGEFYGDFGNYVLNVTVPESFEVGASGNLVEEAVNDDGTKTLTFEASQMRDVAWVASDRFRVTELAWSEKTLKVLEYALPGMAQVSLDSAQFFDNVFGEYAYDTLTVAQVGAGGGMEYPGIVMIGGGSVNEIAHEVAHQWWYAGVGNNEFAEGWLDEGPTTFSSELFQIEVYNASPNVRSAVGFFELGTPVLMRGIDYPNFQTFAITTYTKGSGIFWMLWEILGRDTFLEAMRTYYETYQFKNATTQDLIEVFQTVSGQDLEAFFTTWLTTVETFDVTVKDVVQSEIEDGSYQTSFVLEQTGVQMPVRVKLTLRDDAEQEFIWDGEVNPLPVAISTNVPVVEIRLDPDQNLLESGFARHNNTWKVELSTMLGALCLVGLSRRLRKLTTNSSAQ